ncbi:BTB/POZ protein [Syncephalastrum racemosum]|uniref:BTB/POZ protein n=1 Tax=Syncephalastrum racemosum TaxID=13706 RepID=A0A1X2H1H9_SYNRA|nr:BTB/POZ protein [Syncephalastrum racemosum]
MAAPSSFDTRTTISNICHGSSRITAGEAERQDQLRTALSSLSTHDSSAVLDDYHHDEGLTHDEGWQDFEPDYKQLREEYSSKKQRIFCLIRTKMETLQQLEWQYEKDKQIFHEELSAQYSELCRGLINKRDRLDRAKHQFSQESGVALDAILSSEKVRLNVGGSIFETSLTTLRRDETSLLATMFSGRHALEPEADGSYFIDRDPLHFRHVLNYLRDLRLSSSLLQDKKLCQELLQEAKYYRIDDLVQLLSTSN